MTRVCEDLKVCGSEENKPGTERTCDTDVNIGRDEETLRYDLIFVTIVVVIGILGVIVLLFLRFRDRLHFRRFR